MVFYVAVLLLFFLLVHFSWQWWKASFKLDFVPNIGSFPWIGTLMDTKHMLEFFHKMTDKFGYRFMYWLGPIPQVFTGDANDIGDILRSSTQLSKSVILRILTRPWLGESTFGASPQKWRKLRKLISPGFHSPGLFKEYLNVFESHAKKMNEAIKEEGAGGEKSIDVQPLMSKWTMFIINKTAMGFSVDDTDSEYRKYEEALVVLKTKFSERWFRPYLLPEFMFKLSSIGREFYRNLDIMNEFTVKVINQRIADRINNTNRERIYRSFLDVILDAYDADFFDVKGVLDEVNLFMFAGHDTISVSTSWMLYEIGLHPEVQEKLHQAIVERIDLGDGDLLKKYGNIEYLDMVIKESLRIDPVVIIFQRLLTDDTMINGRLYKKGVEFAISPEAVHHNEKYWSNPNKFDPERFSADNLAKQTPFSFIPFSVGIRNCIGEKFAMWEMRILLFQIVSKYRIKTCHQKPEVAFELIRISRNGLWVQFEER